MMGIYLHEVRKGDEHEVKSKITGKLRDYLKQKYPASYQQIHAHVMSLNARALVGVLFTPGLLDDEIDHIVGGKEVGKKKEEQGSEQSEQEGGLKTMQKIDIERESKVKIEQAIDMKGKKGSQVTEGDEYKNDREEQIGSGRKVNGKGKVAEVSHWNGIGVARYGKDRNASNEEWI